MVIVCVNVSVDDLNFLTPLGAIQQQPKNSYERIRYTYLNSSIILYTSGKLVIQAKKSQEEIFLVLCKQHKLTLQPNSTKKSQEEDFDTSVFLANVTCIIGSDETLKGDTFGGLVVVGALFFKNEESLLQQAGVKDSKLLTDLDCTRIAQQLLKQFPQRFSVQNIFPKEYNSFQQQESLTGLLNRLHMQVGVELKKQEPEAFHVVDKYPGCLAGDMSVTKAETHYLQVAAASIVARHFALEQLGELSQRAGFILPKGSTHVKEALQKLIKNNLKKEEFVKVHFKNVV